MTKYLYDNVFSGQHFGPEELNLTEFEHCVFRQCDFSRSHLTGVTFINCHFDQCRFEGAQINHSALRTVHFEGCHMPAVNFAMIDRLIFEVRFTRCVLDFSKFYALKLRGTVFSHCSMIAVDFMQAQLTEAVFDHCDLYRAEFGKADLRKADCSTSFNYTIDPTVTQVKGARFSREQVAGLLFKHQLVIE